MNLLIFGLIVVKIAQFILVLLISSTPLWITVSIVNRKRATRFFRRKLIRAIQSWTDRRELQREHDAFNALRNI
jgi:hypothetical protein